MAGGVNKCILLGNLCTDPEVRFTPSGAAVANFRLATNESWKDKDGQKQERAEFHRIVVWGKLAELCGEYLKKGRQCYVEGRLQTREWTDKENRKNYTTEVVADHVTFLGGQGGGSSRAGEDDAGGAPTRGGGSGRGAGGGEGGAVFPPFGRSKGQPIHGATQKDLEWYASTAQKDLADPSKARYHEEKRGLLAAINAEAKRQGFTLGAGPTGGGRGGYGSGGDDYGAHDAGNGPDDSIPF